MRPIRVAALVALAAGCAAGPPRLPEALSDDRAPEPGQVPGVRRAAELTTHTANDYAPALSPDGRRLLFVSDRGGSADLWLKGLEGGARRGAVRVTWHTAKDVDPAWSPDGDTIAFTSHRDDPDGDLYTVRTIPLLSAVVSDRLLWQRGAILRRLTDSRSADRSPAFHPDGERLVYTSRPKGGSREDLWILRLDGDEPPRPLTTDGGHDPAVSPDGAWVAFAAARGESPTDHDLFVLRLADGAELRLTSGRALDAQPAWSGDGRHLVFTRFERDTDGDGQLTPSDRGSLHRLDLDGAALTARIDSGDGTLPIAIPLTSPEADDLFPSLFADRVVFASNRRGGGRGALDIVALPLDGAIEERDGATEQAALAEALVGRETLPLELRILAYRKVLRPFDEPPLEVLVERARERIGSLHLAAGELAEAERSFRELVETAPATSPTRALAEVESLRITRLEAESRFRSEAQSHRLDEVIAEGLAELTPIAERFPQNPVVGVRVELERGRHELARRDRVAALAAFRAGEERAQSFGPSLAAEAAFERGRVYQVIGDREGLIGSDLNLLERYGDERPYSTRAARRIVSTLLEDPSLTGEPARLAALRDLADRHPRPAVLPANALLELGRRRMARDELERAEAAFRRVIADFAEAGPELAEARLELADLFHRTGRDEAALEEYLTLQRDLPESERAYRIARQSYIRRGLERGRAALAGNDPRQAIADFVTLIKFDDDIVEAHRGLIEAYAASDDADRIQAHYRARVEERPSSAVTRYALGLARTYGAAPDLEAAEEDVRAAIALDARLSFAHQTLGYLLERRAAEAGERTRAGRALLDEARDAYGTALALTDENDDPRRRADLALNLGNVMYGLSNYRRALELYRERGAAGGFELREQEALFRMRYGESAQKMGALEEAERELGDALRLWTELGRPARRYQTIDLLGLVHQQMGRHLQAVEDYRQALTLSERLGARDNARIAMRNIAVNLTFAAEAGSGLLDWALLEEALSAHRESLRKLDEDRAVEARSTGGDGDGLSLRRLDVALAGDASRAAFGFDAAGERQLALSFMARIYEDAGRPAEAITALERKLETMPPVPRGADRAFALTDRAVLLHQLGRLHQQMGDDATAARRYRESLELGLQLPSPDVAATGVSLNLEHLAALVADGRVSPSVAELRTLIDRTGTFAAGLEGGAQRVPRARIDNALAHLERAAILAEPAAPVATAPAGAPGAPGGAASAVRATLAGLERDAGELERARARLRDGLEALGAPVPGEDARTRRTRATLTLNLLALGPEAARESGATRARLDGLLETLVPGVDDDLLWRALLAGAEPWLAASPDEALGRRAAARALLEQAPPGALPQPAHAALRELYGAVARRARDDGRLEDMLAALDWIPALETRSALAESALAGSFPAIADDDPEVTARWEAYWEAVAELHAARRGEPDADGRAALDRMRAGRPAELAGATLGELLAARPEAAGDAQARLPEGSALVVATQLPGEAALTLVRLDPVSLSVSADPSAAVADASRLYLSARDAAAAERLARAVPAQVPRAAVSSLAHLSAALDARSILEAGHLRIATGPAAAGASAEAPGTTVLAGSLADRRRIGELLPQHAVVEMAVPWTGFGDLLGSRFETGAADGGIRPFTLADLVARPDLHRALLLESAELRPDLRPVAMHLLAAAGYPSVVVSADADARATVVAALELESAGVAALEAGRGGAEVRVHGAVGFDADEALAFAEASYEETLARAARAYREERWEAAADAFAEAASLEALLDLPDDRARILFHLTEAAARAGQFERAARFQARAVEDAERAGDEAALAENLYYLGVFQSRAEHFEAAEESLLRSARIYEGLDAPDRASEALATRGIAQEREGRYGEALSSFVAALDIDRSVGSAEREGRELRRIGRIQLVRLNRYAEAERSFRHAREVLGDAGDAAGWIEATLETGLAREAVGDLDGAIALYEEGMDAALELDEPALGARGRIYRAQARWLAGDYGGAFEDARAVAEAGDALDDPRLSYLSRNLTVLIRWSLNEHERALDDAALALELAKALDEPSEVATVHNNRGIVLRDSGRPAAALEELAKALAIDREIGSRWGEGYDLRNIGMAYLELDRTEEARANLELARDVSRSIGDRVNEAKALVSLGDARLELGAAEPALGDFADAAALAVDLGLPEVEWRAGWGRGRALTRLGRGDEALVALTEAVEVVERMRASLALEEMRNGFATNKVDLYEDVILALLDRGETERAFDYAERSRARGFIDLLGNARVAPAGERSRELLGRVRDVEAEIAAARTLEDPEARAATLATLDSERRDLLAEIQLADPELTSFVSVDPLDTAGVQALLDDDTALLAYFVAEHEVIAWTLRREDIRVTRVPVERDALEARIMRFRERIQEIAPIEDDARALHDLLVRPGLAGVPDGVTVGLVPHGKLHYLSFAALSDGRAYLVERHPLFYVPSASVLSYVLQGTRKPPGQLRVLAIGNPDLGSRDFDLPFSEKEVQSLRWTYPQIDILTGAEATKGWLVEHADRYDVIHLASHGEFDPVNPLSSALKLAHGPTRADGDLTAEDVFGLRLDAELVTLSACQTGLGSIEAGDEVIGMNRAFLYAGTPSLLSTLWRVSDVSTAVLIKHFYRNYDGTSRARALRGAQLHVMGYYPHPSYWAGFTLTGDFR